MRNVTPQGPSPTSTSASSIQKAAAALDGATSTGQRKMTSTVASRMKAFDNGTSLSSAIPSGNNVTSKRASFNGTASQAAHQPHTPKSVARRQSYSEKVAMETAHNDPQVSSRRSSVASQRESTHGKIAEAIETLRDTVLNKNPISPVFVPHVPASQQVNSENHNQLAKMNVHAGDKCTKCQKIVYAVEKIQYDDFVFHKNCLKCKHCNATLKLGNVACLENEFFRKPHFRQLFALKGNYNEGFGRADPKKDWAAHHPKA